jgi:hypothetical protein
MNGPFSTPLTLGLFIYKDRSQKQQGLLFQVNPETLKRSRTVSLSDSSTAQTGGTTSGRGVVGRKFSMKASRWKIDFDLRLDSSRQFPKDLGMMLGRSALGAGVGGLTPIESVVSAMRQLEALVEPTEVAGVKSPRGVEENPPTPEVDFYYGERVWKGYVTSLNFTESLFSASLVPMVVEASISMEIIEPMSSLVAGTVGGALVNIGGALGAAQGVVNTIKGALGK